MKIQKILPFSMFLFKNITLIYAIIALIFFTLGLRISFEFYFCAISLFVILVIYVGSEILLVEYDDWSNIYSYRIIENTHVYHLYKFKVQYRPWGWFFLPYLNLNAFSSLEEAEKYITEHK